VGGIIRRNQFRADAAIVERDTACNRLVAVEDDGVMQFVVDLVREHTRWADGQRLWQRVQPTLASFLDVALRGKDLRIIHSILRLQRAMLATARRPPCGEFDYNILNHGLHVKSLFTPANDGVVRPVLTPFAEAAHIIHRIIVDKPELNCYTNVRAHAAYAAAVLRRRRGTPPGAPLGTPPPTRARPHARRRRPHARAPARAPHARTPHERRRSAWTRRSTTSWRPSSPLPSSWPAWPSSCISRSATCRPGATARRPSSLPPSAHARGTNTHVHARARARVDPRAFASTTHSHTSPPPLPNPRCAVVTPMIMLYFAILMRKQHANSLTFFSIFSTRMIPGGRVATLAKFADVLVNRVCVLCAARCAAACPAPPFLLRPLAICCIPLSPLATAASDRLPPHTHTHITIPPQSAAASGSCGSATSCCWRPVNRAWTLSSTRSPSPSSWSWTTGGWAPAAGRRARTSCPPLAAVRWAAAAVADALPLSRGRLCSPPTHTHTHPPNPPDGSVVNVDDDVKQDLYRRYTGRVLRRAHDREVAAAGGGEAGGSKGEKAALKGGRRRGAWLQRVWPRED